MQNSPASKLFMGAEAKLSRAEKMIAELDAKSSDSLAPLLAELNAQASAAAPGLNVVVNVPQTMADELSVMCGQIALLIRSPLDYLAVEFARLHSGEADKGAFPFGKDEVALEKAIREKGKWFSEEAKEFFRAQRPRMDGDHVLWSLNALCNVDKHQRLISGKGFVTIGGVNEDKPYGFAMAPDWSRYVAGATSVPMVPTPLFRSRVQFGAGIAFAEPAVLAGAPVIESFGDMVATVRKILKAATPLLKK
jgi:hypothetical protein